MPLRASASYNAKIEALVAQFQVRKIEQHSARDEGFKPDLHIAHAISAEDIIGDIITVHTDAQRNLKGQSFTYEGNEVLLADEAWETFTHIAGRIQSSPDYRDTISLRTILDILFEWLKEKYKGRMEFLPLSHLSEKCEAAIQDIEVWIPVAETHVEGQLEFGNVIFKEIKGAFIDQWEQSFSATGRGSKEQMAAMFTRYRRDLQGFAAATMKVRAEPRKAYEVGEREAERSLSLLRCLWPYNIIPYLTSYCVQKGRENIAHPQRLLMKDGIIVDFNEGTENYEMRGHWLTASHIQELKIAGFDNLHALLKERKPTLFQQDVLSALLLYSRSSLQAGLADRITYTLAPLEFLLLNNFTDPQELGVRMVMLLDYRNLNKRKQVVTNIRDVYALRTRLIRGETTQADMEILQRFMTDAWCVFGSVIALKDTFANRQDFIAAIENTKLSGGL